MDPTLLQVIQWTRSGAPHAKDPRLALFQSLYKSSSIDPHTIKAVNDKGKLVVQGKLSYEAPDIAALKRKKLVINRQVKEVQVILGGATPETKVFISGSRPLQSLVLEEVLFLCNLYILFQDDSKQKLFQKLIKEQL